MPIETNHLMRINKQDEMLLENDSKKVYDVMREYANQLNGEIDVDESKEDE